MLKTSNFVSKGFSILCSLGERQIFLKVTDQVNFAQYEAAFDSKEVRLNFDLLVIYEILCRAFDQKEGYEFSFHIASSGTMKLLIRSLINGFLKVDFDLLLREKVLSNDGELTTVVNRLEQQIAALKKESEERIAVLKSEFCQKLEDVLDQNQLLQDKLNLAIIPYGFERHRTGYTVPMFAQASAKKLKIYNDGGHKDFLLEAIESFYELEFLQLDDPAQTLNDLTKLKNDNLKVLDMDLHATGAFNSIQGIQNFPNLEKLSIKRAPHLKDIPTVLKSVTHQIKEINISFCGEVNSMELQTYCQTNGIKLAIA